MDEAATCTRRGESLVPAREARRTRRSTQEEQTLRDLMVYKDANGWEKKCRNREEREYEADREGKETLGGWSED